MQQQQTATLTTIFSEVLANLAFMFSDDEPAETPPGEVWLETTIGYQGPKSGNLCFWCTRSFSVLLAANLLGIDPDDADAESKADDAVKEFMNIICGQLVTALHGAEEVFQLSIPEIRELPESPELLDEPGAEESTLSVEGQRVHLAYAPTD